MNWLENFIEWIAKQMKIVGIVTCRPAIVSPCTQVCWQKPSKNLYWTESSVIYECILYIAHNAVHTNWI